MENLKKAVISEIEKRHAVTPEDFKIKPGETESRAYRLIGRKWNAKPYKGTPEQVEQKIRKALEKQKAKAIAEKLAKIAQVEAAPDKLPYTLIIRLEAYKGYMGWQWKAKDNYGHEGRYTGGCGYDKHSTALAEVLNLNLPILKRMYQAKDKNIAKKNGEIMGYGSGYGMLPYFEGGVGSSCYISTLEKLGYTVQESNDVFIVGEK